MRLLSGLISLIIICFGNSIWAQNYSGSYQLNTPQGQFRIQLFQNGLQVRGTLTTLDGTVYQVQAQVRDGEAAVGFVTSAQSKEYFEAFTEDDTLYVTLADWNDATREPVWASEVEFEFARTGAAAAPGKWPVHPVPPANVRQPYSPAPPAQASSPGNPAPALPPTPERGAATLTPGQQYNAGTRVQSTGDGVSFVIPRDWLGGLRPNQAAFMLGSNTKPGIGLVIMRASATMADIEGLLNTAQNLGDGVVLYPAGPPQKTATEYRLNFSGGQYTGLAVGKLGAEGNGVIFFFGGPADQQSYYTGLMQQLVSSLQFFPPQVSAEVQRWQQLLAGMMLKQMSSYYSGGYDGSYVGGSASKTLHLCSDGSYAYTSSSSLGVDGGGGASGYSGGGGEDSGRWRVEVIGARVTLVLQSQDGSSSMFGITMNEKGETYVDGERAYRVQSDRCR